MTSLVPDVLSGPNVRDNLASESHTTVPEIINKPGPSLTDAQEEWRQLFSGSKEATDNATNSTRLPAMTTANLRANFPWGDTMQKKEPNTTRIYAINVNGISIDKRGGTFDDICRSVKEVQADIFCAQEHNLDTTQYKIRSSLFDTANKHWERNRIVIGTTPITVDTPYKPGGTLMITVESLTGRVVKNARDPWGRWVTQEFTGRANSRVVIFSVYQPVDKAPKAGCITVAAQQASLLCLNQDTVKNPRTAFRRDLLKALKEYDAQAGTSLIVLGDFNEQFGTDPDGMTKMAEELGLMDLMASRHSSTPPATYARGTKRLDYALASPGVCDALTTAGYEEFNAHISSDHRGYFFDFNTNALFGSDTQELASGNKRGLKSSNVQQVTEYIKHKHNTLFGQHNAAERVLRLSLPGDRHKLAESLDADILAASFAAEAKVRQCGEAAWSVELSHARRVVSILKKQLSALKTGYDHSVILYNAISQLDSPIELPTSVSECSTSLRRAKKEVRHIVADSFTRRDEERQQKIAALEASMNSADHKSAKILRRLKKAEDIKALFRKLKYVRTRKKRQGVTRIEIPLHPTDDPQECTEWQQVEVPTLIVRKLTERNQKHFGQAHGTPFTVQPLSDDLGYRGDGPRGDDILNGQYDLDGHDESVQLLLRHLKQVEDISATPIDPTISDDDFRQKLRVWTETTTTSPSGMHLGHYKALIARHAYSSDLSDDELTPDFIEQRDELDRMQTDLRSLHLQMMNYALERGYSYKRWHTIANTILFKDDDNVRLHRTRVIHIYEADYNMVLGMKWRIAMYQAEALRALNDGQYGSRPRRNATDPVFIEELQCEISRATRKPVVLTNYDAKACYDRIILCIAMLVSRKFGVPFSVTQANAHTLEQAIYKVRTELGLADTGYQHSSETPVYGTGQGSANSPAIWCFLSSCLLDGYDEVATPAFYQNPEATISATLGLVGFVDDCNGQTNKFFSDGSDATLQEILGNSTSNTKHWDNILNASGGAIELPKTSFQVMHWIHAANGAPVLAPKNAAHQDLLTIRDRSTGNDVKLKLLSPYQAHKTLGHYKDPAGTQNEQFRQLKKKSDEQTSFLWRCPLTRLETWTFYYACYLPSVCYPLPCSSLTRDRLDQVQRKAMSIIVPRCGFNRHTKREILYGPIELGGANFRHLYIEQGIGQVGLFIKHWRSNSTAGKLLRIAVSWFQYQLGTSFSFLENVTTPLPHLESKWLQSLRDFLASIQSSLHLDDTSLSPLQRHHDSHIMDSILASGKFTAAEVRRLNYCRLHLKAHTVSDLVEVSGVSLDPYKLEGHISRKSSLSKGVQISQDRPASPEWRLWRKANRLWSDESGKLIQPLGLWLQPIKQQRQQHPAYQTASALWIRSDEDFHTYLKCIRVDERKDVYRKTDDSCSWYNFALEAWPVSIIADPATEQWQVLTRGKFATNPKPHFPATFEQYIDGLDPWEIELLTHQDLPTDPFSVSEALSHGVRGVSDGSVWTKSLGAFGWTMSTDTGQRAAEGMGPAPGANPNSYRSEAYGMLAMLCFLKRLAEFTYQHEPWQGIIATDSLSLVDTLQGKTRDDLGISIEEEPVPVDWPLDPLCAEWDLLINIQRLLAEMPGLILQHVKGHQDRDVTYSNLALLAQLNVDADDMANRFQREHGAVRPFAQITEGAGVLLVTPQGSITSKYAAAIRYQATYKPLMQHLQSRNGWSDSTTDRINWPALGTCLKKRMKRRDHYIKLVHGILPTNHQVHRHDPSRKGCPVCAHRDEDWSHILHCPHQSRKDWRANLIIELQRTCEKLKTRSRLKDILIDGIKGWLDSEDPESYRLESALYDDEFHRLIEQQNTIGWNQVFLGRFSWEWSDMQDAYYVTRPDYNPKTSRKGAKWQILIIGRLWTQWYLLWESRNKDVHGADAKQSAEVERRNALRTLNDLYDLRNHYEPSAQDLLMKDIRDHSTRSTWNIKSWITINEPVLRTSYKRAKKMAIRGMRSLRHYWPGT